MQNFLVDPFPFPLKLYPYITMSFIRGGGGGGSSLGRVSSFSSGGHGSRRTELESKRYLHKLKFA